MNKLRNRAGESLSETLVALLISALALVMLAGAVTASTRIVNRSRDAMDDYYDANNSMALMQSATGTTTITLKVSGTSTAVDSATAYYYQNSLQNSIVAYRTPDNQNPYALSINGSTPTSGSN